MRPFALALFRGVADPPPARSRRLAPAVPRRLARMLPFARVDLVRVAEAVLAWVLLMESQSLWWVALGGSGWGVLASLAVALPVALRDRWPLAAWRTTVVPLPAFYYVAAADAEPYALAAMLVYLLVLYSVAVRCDRQITFAVWVITVVAMLIVHPPGMPLGAVVVSVAVLFGYNVRVRRNATSRLVEEEKRAKFAVRAQAVLEERARIARELHDIVAHHMSVIAIQAEAVPLKAAGDPARLEAGLAEIRTLSLEAISELRQVLGVLRDQDGRTDTAPQPGLDRVGELVANARAAGLAVTVRRSGSLDRLPPAVGLSAYRIVQESLSNAMRHAPGAMVALDITCEDDRVRVRVANSPGTSPSGAPGAGQGLVGMRERAALLGGDLEARPVDGGGFKVTATLPITAAEDPP